MQTFLPYVSYARCAACLDDKRLCKQIVEATQILTGRVPTKNHPAVLMWVGHERSLRSYITYMCREYTKRYGKKHSLQPECVFAAEKPYWLTSSRLLMLTHRVNLLRKNFGVYSKVFPKLAKQDLSVYPQGYYWPIAVAPTATQHSLDWLNAYA